MPADVIMQGLKQIFNKEMLLKAVPAAILLAPIVVVLNMVMGLAGGSMGLSLLLAAVLVAIGYAMHPGHENLTQDLVTLLVVAGVALLMSPHLAAIHPVFAVNLSVAGTGLFVVLAGAYSSLGATARYLPL